MTFTGLNGTTYRLDATPIGSGGEGDVYSVQSMDYVVKIYTPGVLNLELMEKLKVMIYHPPDESVLSQVAWPLDMVFDDSKQCRGFVMPKLSINAELGEVYKYPSTLPISAQQKINIAQNICVVIAEVHSAGYVFGDFNPRNIGLDVNTGLVSFLDTDTYHVADPASGNTYRCNVCAPGYAAPELLAKCSDYVAENPSASKDAYAQTPLPTFTKETDNFALAIHIFKLLMNGYTPFGGIAETVSVSQASPGVGDAAVRRNSYCFKPGYKHQSVAIPPLESLPQEIADLFTSTFIEGRADPRRRPDAVEWHGALSRYEKKLVNCARNPLHQYDRKNDGCPLCKADRQYKAIVSGDSPASPLKQSAYAPSVQAQAARAQSSKSPATVPVQNYSKTTQILNRKFLHNVSRITITASVIYIIYMLYMVVLNWQWRMGFDIFLIVGNILHGAYMLFQGIMGIKYRQNATKTKVLRVIASVSFAFVFIPPFWGLFLIVKSVLAALSVLFIISAVKDETFLTRAPGSLFLKAAGITYIMFAAMFSLMTNDLLHWQASRYGFANMFWDYVIDIMAFIWFHLFFGTVSVACNKIPEKAGMLRDFSIISMVLSGVLLVTQYLLVGFWSVQIFVTIVIPFVIIGFTPSTLFLVGAIRNNKISASPRWRPRFSSIIVFAVVALYVVIRLFG